MNYHQSDCFTIGLCEYPIQIEYEQCSEGDITIHLCRIDVSGDADTSVWASVEPDSYPAIERELKRELEEAKYREATAIYTPDSKAGEWPKFLRRQAS